MNNKQQMNSKMYQKITTFFQMRLERRVENWVCIYPLKKHALVKDF